MEPPPTPACRLHARVRLLPPRGTLLMDPRRPFKPVLLHRSQQLSRECGARHVIWKHRVNATARTQRRYSVRLILRAIGEVHPVHDLIWAERSQAVEASALRTPLDPLTMSNRVPMNTFEISAVVVQMLASICSSLTSLRSLPTSLPIAV